MKLFKYIKLIYIEIKAVGFKDWCWYTFYLRRNEFSPKLDFVAYSFRKEYKTIEETYSKIIKDRNKAHIISNILNNITFHHKDISIGFKCEELEKEEQKEFKEFVVNEERWKQVNAILKRLKDFEEASRKSIINIK